VPVFVNRSRANQSRKRT